jgi:acyl-CoA reductase-like NAD-dependent aldehyde dehydrogenase
VKIRAASTAELDRAVTDVRARADEFARLPPRAKANLLRQVLPRLVELAPDWVREACRAKGIPPQSPIAGEEWLAGPFITMRNARLLIENLDAIARSGMPPFGRGVRTRENGRVEVDVFPAGAMDRVLFAGFSARVLLMPGITETLARSRQASFYQQQKPEGRVTVVLGAGNLASIPPTDVFYKMFVCGQVCLLKINPVNAWVGPFLEQTLSPLIDRGYLRIVYGGSEAGAHLVRHPDVDEVHITGSDKTHDLIVWGPPGPERERRKTAGDLVLKKTITSELGNVSPVILVPADYREQELWFQARSIVSMVVNNGAFNCNAARVLILGRGWSQGEKFLGMIREAFEQAPLRKDYYPNARRRYQELLSGRERVERFGRPADGELPWALLPALDSSDANEKFFAEENFCGILGATAIGSSDPVEFLSAATSFCNDRLWGTLNATLIVHPRHEKDTALAWALDRAVLDLRYGTVGINHWPALGFAAVTPPWGGHPGATLADCQSGLGWVHNTFMLEGIEKTVVRGPLVARPKPVWFYDNRQAHRIGRKLVSFEASPHWSKLPGLAISALRG